MSTPSGQRQQKMKKKKKSLFRANKLQKADSIVVKKFKILQLFNNILRSICEANGCSMRLMTFTENSFIVFI